MGGRTIKIGHIGVGQRRSPPEGWGESVERSSARTVQLDSEPTQSCRGSDGSFAPIPVAPEATIEPRGSSLLGHSASHSEWLFLVESGCGAVVLGRPCRLPPLSSGGALVGRP